MTEKYKNKYRISSARLNGWDYGWVAAYFVTLCTKKQEHYFGRVVRDEMQLSLIGRIVYAEWMKTPTIRPDMNLELGEFVVMPNHFHAVIFIGDNEFNRHPDHSTTIPAKECTDAMPCVSISAKELRDAKHCVCTWQKNSVETEFKNLFAAQSKNLASIIRGFKALVTINARRLTSDFGWQARFHDHIIRNEKSFAKISEYIKYNPLTWEKDKFNKMG